MVNKASRSILHPHLYKRLNWWHCQALGVVGIGCDPASAYDSWIELLIKKEYLSIYTNKITHFLPKGEFI
jgi:hypothetical protein